MKLSISLVLSSVLFATAANAHQKPVPNPNVNVGVKVNNQTEIHNTVKAQSSSNSRAESDSQSASFSNATGGNATAAGGNASALGVVKIDNRQQSIQWINPAVNAPSLGIGATLVNGEIVPQVVFAIPFATRSSKLDETSRIALIAKECPAINAMTITGAPSREMKQLREFCRGVNLPAALPVGGGVEPVRLPVPVLPPAPTFVPTVPRPAATPAKPG